MKNSPLYLDFAEPLTESEWVTDRSRGAGWGSDSRKEETVRSSVCVTHREGPGGRRRRRRGGSGCRGRRQKGVSGWRETVVAREGIKPRSAARSIQPPPPTPRPLLEDLSLQPSLRTSVLSSLPFLPSPHSLLSLSLSLRPDNCTYWIRRYYFY